MKGKFTSVDGKPMTYVYDGFVRESDQRPHGAGVKKWSNGQIEEGNFRDGKKHGQCKCTFADGAVYVGEWVEWKRHGRGRFTWPNGDVHEGEYRNGKANGQGTKTFTDGRHKSGTWRDDKFVG